MWPPGHRGCSGARHAPGLGVLVRRKPDYGGVRPFTFLAETLAAGGGRFVQCNKKDWPVDGLPKEFLNL
jgi:hypothetical protein